MATINLGAIKFNWKGAYNNSTAYAVDDVVSSGGNSYVCIQASQGNAVGNATAYWNIMSAAGAAGAEGGTSTLTTRGDLLTRGASAVARLAKGTAGQVLGQGANDPAWVNGSSSTLTTQGDVLYRDGSGLQRLAKGTAGKALVMNSAANAPEWGTVAGGKVLQVVQNTKSDTASWTGNIARVDTGLQAAITPSATSSKILISWIINIGYHVDNNQWFLHMDRNGTEIAAGDSSSQRKSSHYAPLNYQATNQGYMSNSASGSFLDSPSSTSARTYKIQHSTTGNGGAFYINRSSEDRQHTGYDNRGYSGIILMEIGA